ncbi:MAG: tRNA-dihydrouridine synthase family protein [Lachnospiraceae bacterium]|nr:tRNA-dihydrouridine synthase family protein [Lachnospiraceae bacterium]
MYIAMAPMEGITTVNFRNVYKKHFSGIDRFYTPFLSANHTHKFHGSEKKEYTPFQPDLVPQVLTNNAEDFIWALNVLKEAGYDEVNLNTGCPSGTVTAKRKGAGMLMEPDKLRIFFDRVFEEKERVALPHISLKTRIGYSSPEEVPVIADVFRSFPFKEIIIHPRLRSDFYNNTPSISGFTMMKESLSDKTLVMYNGDIKSTADVDTLMENCPRIERIMIGRGILMDPALPAKIKGKGGSKKPDSDVRSFLDDLYSAYDNIGYDERTILFKMKDLWNFLGNAFPEREREIRNIKKAKKKADYDAAVNSIF